MIPHKVTQEQLVQFVLGELPAEQAREIQAHLRECEPCAKAVGRLQTLLDCADRMSAAPEDGNDVESANREVLLTAEKNDQSQMRRATTSRAAFFRRTIMNHRMMKWAVAAVVALAVIGGWSLFSGGGSGNAYAQAVDRLHGAGTLMFNMVTMTGQKEMPTVRMNVAFKEPGSVRIATADGFVTVAQTTQNGMEGISLIPVTKNYLQIKADNLPTNAGSDPWVTTERLRALPAQADETLGRKQIDGRELDGFRVHGDDAQTTVWIDPGTGELIRVELEFANAPGMNTIMSDFQLDVALDDSLFSLTPPQGYTPIEMKADADASTVREQDLVEFLRFWSVWTKDATFPPLVAGAELAKITFQMAGEGKFVGPCPPGYDAARQQGIMYRGMLFVAGLPAGTWRYAGQNVCFGDPATPVFWYQPAGSPTWRIVYADLHTMDIDAANLPK
ncbi:MAG: zf-HC2 domain-containing protein [Phycisphaerales bacterium]